MNRAVGFPNRDQRELLVKFKVIKFLGKGSYGSVFQVQRLGDGQNYALKEMDCRSMSQAEREDSVNEVRLLASVRHPNVVMYHEAFLDGNRLCIIMEYAPDGDLSKVIKKWQMMRKPMPEDLIWKLFIQIAKGLACLHNMRILHRDIKPGNIMVMSGDVAKIGDLGIAKLLTSTMAAKTQIGTPHYMPPEIWKNRPYSFSSDTWAMGCILYEMATFNVPFEARSMNELRVKVTRGTYPPVPSTYSKELADLVRDCLDQTPERRPTMDRILASPAVQSRLHLLGEGARAPPATSGSVINTIKVPRGNFAAIKERLPPANYASDMGNILGKYGAIPEGNEEADVVEFKPPAPPAVPYHKPVLVGGGGPPRPAPLPPAPPQALLPRLPIIPGAAPRAPPLPVPAPQYRYPGAGVAAQSPGAQSHITKLSAISKPAGVGVKPAPVSENHAAYGAFYHQGVKGPGAAAKSRVYEDIKAYAAANRKPWSGAAYGAGAPAPALRGPPGHGVRFAGLGVPGAPPAGAPPGARPQPWNYGVKAGAQAAARAYVNQVRAGAAAGAVPGAGGAQPPRYPQVAPWQAGGRRY